MATSTFSINEKLNREYIMKYKKEIIEWMNGTPIQWKSKNYHDKWEDLPKIDSDTVESFTVSKKGLIFVQCEHFSLDFLNDNSMEFRIKPDSIILTYRNAVVQTQAGTFKVVTINNTNHFKEKEVFFFNGEKFIGWVGETQEIDLNTLVV